MTKNQKISHNNKNMKHYKVQLFNEQTKEWKTESSFDEYEDAKKRCIEIVGDEDYYSESIRETILETPEKEGYKWNGKEYMDKKGRTKKAEEKEIFYASSGYFSTKDSKYWICRISVL